jgi:hypothetical protein
MNGAYGRWGAHGQGSAQPSWGAHWGAFDTIKLAVKASAQIKRAVSGITLSDYRQAEDFSSFLYTADSTGAAYFKAAYWLAVASRLMSNTGLTIKAGKALAKGQATSGTAIFGVSLGASSILTDAGKAVAAVAEQTGSAQGAAVARILGVQATQVEGAVQRAWETSLTGRVVDAARGSIATVGRAAEVAVAPKPTWFWPVAIGGGVLFLALVLGIVLRTSPTGMAARAAISRTNRRRRGR